MGGEATLALASAAAALVEGTEKRASEMVLLILRKSDESENVLVVTP